MSMDQHPDLATAPPAWTKSPTVLTTARTSALPSPTCNHAAIQPGGGSELDQFLPAPRWHHNKRRVRARGIGMMDRTGEGVVRVALQVHLLADALVRPRPVERHGEAVARRRLALRDAAVAERGPSPEAGAEVGVPEDAAAVLRLQRLRQALHACKIEIKKITLLKFPFIQLIQNYYESLTTALMIKAMFVPLILAAISRCFDLLSKPS